MLNKSKNNKIKEKTIDVNIETQIKQNIIS